MSEILELYESNPDQFFYLVAAALIVLLSFVLLLRLWLKHATRRRIKSAIAKMGGQAVENIVLSDSVEGSVHIDFCIFSHGQVFVLNIQDYPGILFGGEKIEQWTQLYEGKSYKFDNPLYYNEMCVQVVKEALPGLPVWGQVVFTHHGEFPKGKPDRVSMLTDLADDLLSDYRDKKATEVQKENWQGFVENLRINRDTRIYNMQSV